MSTTTTITPEELLLHRAWLQRLARRLVDPSTADDLVQETWAAAVRSSPDSSRPLRPWLAEVLRNLARMRARSLGRWAARAPRVRAAIDQPLPTPEELLTYHEAQRLVAEAVAELEEPYRSTVLLCYAQEIPPAEIARRQGIAGGTVRWRLKRGLDQLRAKLDARYGNDRQTWTAMLAPLAARGLGTGAVGAGAPVIAGAARAPLVKVLVPLAGGSMLAALVVAWLGAPASDVDRPVADAPTRSGAAWVTPGSVPRLVTAPGAAATGPGAPPPAASEPPRPGGPAGAALAAVPPDREEALRRAAEPADSPARGNPDAPVTIVTYTEFQCPFCARVIPTLRELMAAYPKEVRLIFKHLPLPFHESAGLAAEASWAAHEQGKFWEMHDRLFAKPGPLDPAALEEHARALGLDLPRWKAAFDSGKYRERVAADQKLAKEAGIHGTPSFLVNGELMQGAQPLPAFKRQVEAALAKARGLPAPAAAPAGPAAAVAREAAPRPALGGPAPGENPFWPPVAITLPDAVLGDRIAQRFVTADAPLRGNGKGPVEILYFTDLACGECSRSRLLLQGLLATHGEHVKVLAKISAPPMPGAPTLAAEAALAAHAQGKFWEYHDAFGPGPAGPERARFEDVARKAGVDLEAIRAALDDGRHRAALEEERELITAAKLGAGALVVNGRLAESPLSLIQLVDSAIRKAGRRPPARAVPGTAPELNPRAPGYNPKLLLMHMSPRQLFAYEHRDDAWAGPIEKELGATVARDLKAIEPKLGGTSVECRASICRMRWRIGGADPRVVSSAVRFLYGLTDVLRPGGPDTQYLILRGGSPSSAADALVRIKSRRSSLLYTHRTGRAAQKAPFPIERLPE